MIAVTAALNALYAILGSDAFKRLAPQVAALLGRDQGLTDAEVQNILSNIADYDERIRHHESKLPTGRPASSRPPGHE